MFGYLTFIAALLIFVECEDQSWHTSQIVLRKLYELQEEHFGVFNDYLDFETKRLEELKKYFYSCSLACSVFVLLLSSRNLLSTISNFAAIHEWRHEIMSPKNTHLRSHVQAVKAMAWLRQKLLRVDDLLDNKQSLEALKTIDERKSLSGDHVTHAYRALRRLQRFYAIPASAMAAGVSYYDDRIVGAPLNAYECYVMSEYCFNDHDMYGVLDWAVEAYKKRNDGSAECIDIDKLHFYIVSSSAFTGFRFDGLIHLNKIKHSKKTERMAQHYFLMKNELRTMHEEQTLKFFDVYNDFLSANYLGYAEFINLCRYGVSLRTLPTDLKCSYQTKDSYYRILMPFKVEDINNDPYIKIYHDVLYEKEIVKIKTVAAETMTDAKVRNSAMSRPVSEEITRSGQVSWVQNTKEETLFKILNARVESFTGFSTDSAEQYQVVNYGLGGHYVPHHDAFLRSLADEKSGSRIVTVLFYLTDVEDDGYTAYPWLGIISPAVKGSALVWHNIHMSDGNLHYESLHGACPILKGNKWIMTKWLREKGQHLPYDWKNY